MNAEQDTNEYLALARRLVEQIEQGKDDAADQTIDRLTRIRETTLFQELGTLTRELHEALKSVRVDARLSDLAANDIPDARERLNHVISMTEQSAHRTLTAIETSLPLAGEIGQQAQQLGEQWRRFRNRDLSAQEFRLLSRDMDRFFGVAERHGAALRDSLSDALLAQDYQDLTGQIIRRVIHLVQEVQEGLVELVRISGARLSENPVDDSDQARDRSRRGEGPALPGRDADVVSGQDEVDDLLSSFGF